ncbi:proton-coupled amino acid transporter-like protein CG1139 isoform X2 [Planococcus citri]|uniref:proton-coupled amino acid transporter-like protein CG1139 isoform X2 n=1 Tax=Planococcus citri TaxID=170843 RepID=UPI0031F7719A
MWRNRLWMENGYDNPVSIEQTANDTPSPPPPPPPPAAHPYSHSVHFENTRVPAAAPAAAANGSNSQSSGGVYVIPVDTHTTRSNCKNGAGAAKNEKHQLAGLNGINGDRQHKLNKSSLSEKAYIDYDPHQHIQHKNPTSYLDTIFHLLRASLGTGILAMPNAFQNAGYAVGLVGTMIIGFMCTYNIHTLVSSEYELCKRRKIPSMTYPETVQAAFEEGPARLRCLARFASVVTNLLLALYQIGSSSIYALFIASNLQDVGQSYFGSELNLRVVLLYLLVPSVIICWVRNLKLLVPFSTIGNVATIVSFALIFRYVFDEVPTFAYREPVGTMRGIPLFFGTVLFAMEAIGVVMPLKNQMKKPRQFGSLFGVLNASMLPISILYTFMGFFGYLKYGPATQGSITLNLPTEERLAKAVKLLYSGAIFITYALSNYVICDIVWTNGIKSKMNNPSVCCRILFEYVIRTGVVFLTFFLAAAVPNLEIFISFVGAFCLSSIGVAFPAIVEILTFWNNHEDAFQFSIMIFRNIIIIVIAILAFTIGVSSSVAKFVQEVL